MKDKKTGLIQTLIGAVILVIGIMLCVNTYIVKGNKAYAFSLLVTLLGIVILIAGFPGETQADHEEVMEFIDEVEFDRLGVFTYSREEDTPAATMPDQIDQDTMDTWRDELMALQQEISIDKSAQMVGKTIDVMVEGYIAEDNTYVGRSYKDAPNVDGMVFFECDRELMSGDFVSVKITGSTEYDLMGIMEENV